MNVRKFIRIHRAGGWSFAEIAVALNKLSALPFRRGWSWLRVRLYGGY
jgi:hypothetical protein